MGALHKRADFPHNWPVTQKVFPCHDVFMIYAQCKLGLADFNWKLVVQVITQIRQYANVLHAISPGQFTWHLASISKECALAVLTCFKTWWPQYMEAVEMLRINISSEGSLITINWLLFNLRCALSPGTPFTYLAWISNYNHYEVWNGTTYPFINFNSATFKA